MWVFDVWPHQFLCCMMSCIQMQFRCFWFACEGWAWRYIKTFTFKSTPIYLDLSITNSTIPNISSENMWIFGISLDDFEWLPLPNSHTWCYTVRLQWLEENTGTVPCFVREASKDLIWTWIAFFIHTLVYRSGGLFFNDNKKSVITEMIIPPS